MMKFSINTIVFNLIIKLFNLEVGEMYSIKIKKTCT